MRSAAAGDPEPAFAGVAVAPRDATGPQARATRAPGRKLVTDLQRPPYRIAAGGRTNIVPVSRFGCGSPPPSGVSSLPVQPACGARRRARSCPLRRPKTALRPRGPMSAEEATESSERPASASRAPSPTASSSPRSSPRSPLSPRRPRCSPGSRSTGRTEVSGLGCARRLLRPRRARRVRGRLRDRRAHAARLRADALPRTAPAVPLLVVLGFFLSTVPELLRGKWHVGRPPGSTSSAAGTPSGPCSWSPWPVPTSRTCTRCRSWRSRSRPSSHSTSPARRGAGSRSACRPRRSSRRSAPCTSSTSR